jgi:hypothetical protein
MADTKISALPASTTPLAGTEVLPIVQSGATKQVSVANLTAGRAISATAVTASTGNFIVGTSGQGVDFAATPGTGTSELLADYEEGTWTPTDVSGASLTFTNLTDNCFYTKVGNLVTCIFNITYPATADVNSAYIGGLPFTSKSTANAIAGGQFSYTNYGAFLSMAVNTGATNFYFWTSAGGLITNATASGKIFRGVITYMV